MKKSYYIITGAFVLVLAGLFAVPAYFNSRDGREAVQGADAEATPEERVEAYVRANISSLSPQKEVLGGTFYVTEFDARNGRGTVSYEDGHVAYEADFTYRVSDDGEVSILSFVATPAADQNIPPSEADILK